jgi:hypothetical protein
MSTPRNHHSVSQCHIRYFRSKEDEFYYCYDKETDNFYRKPSEKSIFSELDANTRFKNGALDHSSLENELQLTFENDFVKHASNIFDFISAQNKDGKAIVSSLYYIIRYGLIADTRSPHYKKTTDEAVNSLLKETARKVKILGDEVQSNFILQQIEETKTKYSNLLEYTDIAISRLKRIGSLRFTIANIKTDDKFILPDTGCYLKRARINNYINPNIQEVAIIGVPLTDKIFIYGESTKLSSISNDTLLINNTPSELVNSINKDLFDFAIKTVITSDNTSLNSIIGRCKAE